MRKAILKSFIFLFIFFVSISSVLGCGNNSQSNYDKDGFMTLSIWGGDEYVGETGKKFEKWIDIFNESQQAKDLKVRLTFKSLSQLPVTLNTTVLTNKNMPDIVIWDRFSTPTYNYLLYPIDELVEKDNINLDVFQQEALNELKFEDKLYGLPLDLDPWGIYVNLDLVDAYNATAAEADKIDVNKLDTWSRILSAAQKLTQYDSKGNVTVAGLNTTSMDGQFFSFVYSAGGELINSDKTSSSYGDTVLVPIDKLTSSPQSKRVYDTLGFIKDLYSKKICSSGLGGTDAFVNNKLAMTYGSVYFTDNIADYTTQKMRTKFLPFPKRDLTYIGKTEPQVINPDENSDGLVNGQFGGVLGGYGLSIVYPTAKNRTQKWEERKNMAWEVIKLWMLNDEMQEKYFTTAEVITSRTDLYDNEFYQKDSPTSISNITDIIDYVQYYKMRPNVEGYEQFESNVVRTYIQLMYEGDTVLKTYNNILTEGNKLLRQMQGRA
ncbi:MAG TPA: extracellular solute-binding protein [Clostridia bacterium]